MPPTAGCLLENISYGGPQLQDYNFEQQISNLTFLIVPLNEFTQLSSAAIPHNTYGTTQRSFMWSLHDHTKWHFWKRTHPRRWRIWEWKQVSAYPLLSEEHPGFTMFLPMRTSPSTLPLHPPQLHDIQTAILYATAYCWAAPMKRALYQLVAHHIVEWNLPY